MAEIKMASLIRILVELRYKIINPALGENELRTMDDFTIKVERNKEIISLNVIEEYIHDLETKQISIFDHTHYDKFFVLNTLYIILILISPKDAKKHLGNMYASKDKMVWEYYKEYVLDDEMIDEDLSEMGFFEKFFHHFTVLFEPFRESVQKWEMYRKASIIFIVLLIFILLILLDRLG